MKTTAKYVLSLHRLSREAFNTTNGYHAITKDLLQDFNVTETQMNGLLNRYHLCDSEILQTIVKRCELVIDVMDFVKFKQDILMWRKTTDLLQRWLDEIKEQRQQPVEFKTKEELSQNNL